MTGHGRTASARALPEGKADYTLRIGTRPGGTGARPDYFHHHLQRPVSRPAAAVQGRPAGRSWISYNDTDTPEQLHWHGQFLPVDVDGAAEEGTPFIPAHGMRRIAFTPGPAGFRFYHTHVVGARQSQRRANTAARSGPVYIEPRHEPGDYDQEVFLVLKEFEPTFSRGGDMPMDFLAPADRVKALEDARRIGHESLIGAGHAARLRGGLFVVFHQRPHAGPRRTDPRQSGPARLAARAQRQRHGDPQPRVAGPHVQSRRAGRQSRPRPGRSPGALDRHGRAHLRHRGNEPSGRLGAGRSGRRRPRARHGHCRRVCRARAANRAGANPSRSAGTTPASPHRSPPPASRTR